MFLIAISLRAKNEEDFDYSTLLDVSRFFLTHEVSRKYALKEIILVEEPSYLEPIPYLPLNQQIRKISDEEPWLIIFESENQQKYCALINYSKKKIILILKLH